MLKGLGKRYRQGMAFMLAVVMTAVNILAGAGTAYASNQEGETSGSGADVCYEINPEALSNAISQIKEQISSSSAVPVFREALGSRYVMGSNIPEKMYALSVSENQVSSGTLYETDMQVYYTPGSGGQSEKVIVLFVNQSLENLVFQVKIGEGHEFTCDVSGMSVPTASPADLPAATPAGPPAKPHAGAVEIGVTELGLETAEIKQVSSDLRDFLEDVQITNEDGSAITDKKLYIGQKYHITLSFAEKGAQELQFDVENGVLTYQFPSGFKVDPQEGLKLTVLIDGKPVLAGHYSINEDGLMTITLTDEGKEKLEEAPNVSLRFDMNGEAQAVSGGASGSFDFGNTGKDFEFEVMDQPRVKMEKQGRYTENEDKKGGTLAYTVKTTVEHGQVYDAVITDTITPPKTSAFSLETVQDVTVTLTRDGETFKLSDGVDYELIPETSAGPDELYPPQTFRVKLKGKYVPLKEEDVLNVSYNYNVAYVRGSTDTFWGNAVNEARFTGSMPVEDPSNPGTSITARVEEKAGSNVEIQAVPCGNGVVWKEQAYSEMEHTLHYTLYTVVPAGIWTPLFIQDNMVVEYNGKRWQIPEFKEGGRVKNLTVKAVDLGEVNWTEDTDWEKKYQDLVEDKKRATKLEGYNFEDTATGYDPSDKDKYVYRLGNETLNIIFGLDKGPEWWYDWSTWGSWNYGNDRLIITEYDLDMKDSSGSDKITLWGLDWGSDGKPVETIELTPSEVLLAGIKNIVNLRYGNYYPGYSVYFNNAEKMNKTGKLDKNTNTIEYTVTMNTTDSTVWNYFEDVKKDWYAIDHTAHGWDLAAYELSMKAVFYDDLPDGWKYVDGSLYAVAQDVWGSESRFDYQEYKLGPIDSDGNINAPLVFFYNREAANHDLFNTFSQTLTKLSFTYELRATDAWLKEHATSYDEVSHIDNKAEIKDKIDPERWSADHTIEYIPAKLTKKAVQVGESELLEFTLGVNPQGEKLEDSFGRKLQSLTVTDSSENLEIKPETITVQNAKGETLEKIPLENDQVLLDPNQWGMLPNDGESQFKILVPNGVALTVTYQAVIIDAKLGEEKSISNQASIVGVDGAESGYANAISVHNILGFGSGDTHSIMVEKVDGTNQNNGLEGAKFDFYIVLKQGSALNETGTITIKGTTDIKYSVHKINTTEYSTDTSGTFIIQDGSLEPGNTYILKETGAPDGYVMPTEPYYVFEYNEDTEAPLKLTYGKGSASGLVLKLANEPKLGSLKVTKTVAGDAPKSETDTKIYSFTVTGDNYSKSFELKAGESMLLEDLPTGTYTVTENRDGTAITNYTLTVTGEGEKAVEKGKTTEVTVTNTYTRDRGSLRVTKTVADEDGVAAGKTYSFTVTGPNEYSTTFELKADESKTLEDLPTGEYTITEADAGIEGYTLEVTGDGTVVVAAGMTAEVTVTNTYTPQPGSLTITKAVVGGGEAAEGMAYTFTVTGPEGYEETVTITGNGSATLENLVPGEYTVTEQDAAIEGYTLAVSNTEPAVVAPGQSADVTVTNTYTEIVGDLTITKSVTGGGEEARTKTYTFDITGPEGYSNSVTITGAGTVSLEDLVPGEYTVTERDASIEGYTYEVSGEGTVTVTQENAAGVTVTNTYTQLLGSLTITKTVEGGGEEAAGKVYTFTVTGPESYSETVTITGNGSAELENLVPGTYTVTEAEAGIEGYAWTVSGTGSVEVTGGENTSAAVTNTYTQTTGSLTITKVVDGGGATAADKEYTFTVTGPDGYSSTVTITGNGSAVLENLAPGEYTVTEQDAAIAGYTLTVTGEGTAAVEAGRNAEITVTNRYRRPERPTEPTEPNNPPENPPENPTEIPENPTPLGDRPPIENLSDDPTPLSSYNELENIGDEDLPLAFMAPVTGDEKSVGPAAVFALLALGMMGAFGILAFKKDEEDA